MEAFDQKTNRSIEAQKADQRLGEMKSSDNSSAKQAVLSGDNVALAANCALASKQENI
jgi:hypothetical protein|tara:strand:+ start:220 stop:393 length:174 start_codon:yes stop_codon:yes gene_type:complete